MYKKQSKPDNIDLKQISTKTIIQPKTGEPELRYDKTSNWQKTLINTGSSVPEAFTTLLHNTSLNK